MTRQEMLKKLVDMANGLSKDASLMAQAEIFSACCDWNAEHEDEEIFMCEHDNEETGMVDGFYIEYDYWTFTD